MIRQLINRLNPSRRRRPGLVSPTHGAESLEPRTLLTGTVTTSLLGPSFLQISGDAQGNDIRIRGGRNQGDVTIVGKNGTTVDGATRTTYRGIDRITAQMEGGDDTVRVSRLNFTNQTATAGQLALAGILVDAGAGDDLVIIASSTVSADGKGIASTANAFIQVRGDKASGSAGNDVLNVSNVAVLATGAERTAAQIDVFGDYVNPSAGNDKVTVKRSTVRAFGGTRSNNALISVQEVRGGGDDYYAVVRNTVTATDAGASSRVTVETRKGNDTVVVKKSQFDRLQARLGTEDDRMLLVGNQIGTLAVLDGGDGIDSLSARKNTGAVNATNFEN